MLNDVRGGGFSNIPKLTFAGVGLILLCLELCNSMVLLMLFLIVSIELAKSHFIASNPFEIG